MREINGDLWDYHEAGYWIGITTNGIVNSKGEAVMGEEIAEQAAKRFAGFAKDFGYALTLYGNRLLTFPDLRLFTFPVKKHWKDQASLELIATSGNQLMYFLDFSSIHAALPRPGCQNGRLTWDVVRPVIEPILGDRVLIVDWSV